MTQDIGDLAPGDVYSAAFDWTGFQRLRVNSIDDPVFRLAYAKLWKEFGHLGEVETESILSSRMQWKPTEIFTGHSFCYFMNVVLRDGEFAAVRDHTVISQVSRGETVVHLSHALIAPEYRRTGMAGWLRAWPIQHARWVRQTLGLDTSGPVTLVAEMEGHDPSVMAQFARLRSYQKSGFLMVDPAVVDYYQPDFRPPEEIDRTGGPRPIPLRLLVRRVGREREQEILGGELRNLVSAIYKMYEQGFRSQDMVSIWTHLESAYPPLEAKIKLLDPLCRK